MPIVAACILILKFEMFLCHSVDQGTLFSQQHAHILSEYLYLIEDPDSLLEVVLQLCFPYKEQ